MDIFIMNLPIDLKKKILDMTLELRKPKCVLNKSLEMDIKTAYKIRYIYIYYKNTYSDFYYSDFLENDLLHFLNDDQALHVNNISPRLIRLFSNYDIEQIIDMLSINNTNCCNPMRNIYKYWFCMTPRERILFYKRYVP